MAHISEFWKGTEVVLDNQASDKDVSLQIEPIPVIGFVADHHSIPVHSGNGLVSHTDIIVLSLF